MTVFHIDNMQQVSDVNQFVIPCASLTFTAPTEGEVYTNTAYTRPVLPSEDVRTYDGMHRYHTFALSP